MINAISFYRIAHYFYIKKIPILPMIIKFFIFIILTRQFNIRWLSSICYFRMPEVLAYSIRHLLQFPQMGDCLIL